MEREPQDSLIKKDSDPLIDYLNKGVVLTVKCLACLMVVVIFWGLIDVVAHLWHQVINQPQTFFETEKILNMFGSFLAVLIAIEIFLNIVFYLQKDAIHVPLVLATALTAIARKVIILDYNTTEPEYIYATAAVILAVGVSYWLVTKK